MRQQDKHRKHALGGAPRSFLGVQDLQMHGHITANSMVAPEASSVRAVCRGRMHSLSACPVFFLAHWLLAAL